MVHFKFEEVCDTGHLVYYSTLVERPRVIQVLDDVTGINLQYFSLNLRYQKLFLKVHGGVLKEHSSFLPYCRLN